MFYKNHMPVIMAARAKARAAFHWSNIWTMVSNPARDVDVFPRFSCYVALYK
jgi:hypothetical protein